MVFATSAHNLLKGCIVRMLAFLLPKCRESQHLHNAENLELIQNINSVRTTRHSDQRQQERPCDSCVL